MLDIDWTALSSCVSATAVTVGVVVALFQLRSINANERIKATIEYLARFDDAAVEVPPPGATITAARACNIMANTLRTPEAQSWYRQNVWDVYEGSMSTDPSDATANVFRRETAGVAVAANYFIVAESLIRRRRLDADLFFEAVAGYADDLWKFASAFHDVDRNAEAVYNHLGYQALARAAKAWLDKYGYRHLTRVSRADS